MKKTLIAMAAIAAAGVASAQSSVTLYGVADVALSKSTGTSAKLASPGTMNNGTSRWGIKGEEDLGGGLKAGFNYEAGLSLEDGSTGQGGGNYFSRHSYMYLAGGFGKLSLGRTLNPTFYSVATWELTGAANYSAAISQFGAVLGGARNSGQIAYTTPNMGGFDATIGYVLKGNREDEKAKYDLNARYINGPFRVALGYNKVQDAEKNVTLGGRYTMGDFAVALSYNDPAGVSKGFTIGGMAKAGPVSLALDIARDTEAKDTDLMVEAKYPLSKRTFAYVAVLRDGEKKNGALKAADAGEASTGFGLGIRHNF
ncbi:porin [Hydrogenophaga sp. 5NK40-0174]|uniref:porin n=1 Tax=Hydrogenophaga sp. 5NK40-0174 TaxID=3127649 RepID=UPI00310BFE1F